MTQEEINDSIPEDQDEPVRLESEAKEEGVTVETQITDPRVLYQFDYTPNPKVTVKYQVTKPYPEGRKAKDPGMSLSVLGVNNKELENVLTARPLANIGRGQNTVEWLEALQDGQRHLIRDDALEGSLERDASDWRQTIEVEGSELGLGRPKFEDVDGGSDRLTGMNAKIRMQTLLGIGSPVRFPLWHTGIWITLKTPGESELLELDRQIGQEKIQLGRLTNGLIYSNSSVYISNLLIDFVLDHVLDASVRFTNAEELKDIILTTDIPTLIWGSMVSVYTNGYPYQQPCMADPDKCQHVVSEMINLSKICFTDYSALTQAQRKHMQKRSAKFTREELDRYQQDHRYTELGKIMFDPEPGFNIQLKVPTITQYQEIGMNWVDTVVSAVNDSMTAGASDDRRNEEIFRQAQASNLMQYAHWIKHVAWTGDSETKYTDDRETLGELIEILTAKKELGEQFLSGVKRYIEDATISLIATPRISCPKCGEPMSEESKQHPHLVPMDMVSSFFTIRTHRIIKAMNRYTM